MDEVRIEVQCNSCKGTGVYRGFTERPGFGAVCNDCKGSGKAIIKYIPFTGRKEIGDIKFVYYSGGIPYSKDGADNREKGAISYKEFLMGSMPSHPKE
ncbi:hypothetical protein BMS3Abin15_00806 [bacterium BMS3Abin15]|nr:hypothetical protein BMS3Abin15_00806 [bacterium BMS3Abin15]HDH07398.1 hypothetical protein [Candidatus Moranbacteria bacterium]HDZ85286.1 hypothetical protein [Candidatus Moranbacteria bacterium]